MESKKYKLAGYRGYCAILLDEKADSSHMYCVLGMIKDDVPACTLAETTKTNFLCYAEDLASAISYASGYTAGIKEIRFGLENVVSKDHLISLSEISY